MNELLKNLRATWDEADKRQRTTFAIAAAGVAVLAIVLLTWSLRTDYQVLFADLDARDGAAIVEELRRMKVPYKIKDDGTKILVEESRVHETRLQLMGRGVAISGGVGFEIFDNKDIGMTEYTQKINYQRALQGELARTIMSIQQVKHARVHLVVAESSIFKRQKVKPKASVSLIVKPGGSLSAEQISGVQRLVAAAVPGLEPGAVTVLDQRGITLSAAIDGEEGYAAVTGQLKLKKNAEEYFARKISEVLDRTFGHGQAIVSVDVTLNFDEIRRTQESIVPVRAGAGDEVGAVVRKRQSVYRHGKNPVTKATVNGESQYAVSPELNSTTEVEYEIGKSVEQVVTSPGGIRRMSVGIVVPRANSEQVARIHSIVSMVVGYNESRGDAIAIQPIDQLIAADNASEPANATNNSTGKPPQWWQRLGTKDVLIALLALGIIGGLVMTAIRYVRPRPTPLPSGSLSDDERRARLAEIQALINGNNTKGQI